MSGIDYRIVVDTAQYPGYMLEPGSPPSYSFATGDASLTVTTGPYGSTLPNVNIYEKNNNQKLLKMRIVSLIA